MHNSAAIARKQAFRKRVMQDSTRKSELVSGINDLLQ